MSLHNIIFALVFCIATAIANFYIYKRFFNAIFKNYKLLNAVICIFLFISNTVFLFSMRANYLPSFIYSLLASLLGFSFFFFLIAIIYDVVKFICIKNKAIDLNRRRALKFILDLGFLFIAASCFFKGLYNALSVPNIKRVGIKAKVNKKIAMVSDIHLGKNLHSSFLEKLIEKINSQNPDIVVIVGDLIDTDIEEIDYLDLLNTFNAPVYYVTGNHEFYHNAESILKELKKTNINVLENSSIDLGDIVISGVNDLKGEKYGMGMDLEKIYSNFLDNKYNILLAHQPKVAKENDLSKFDLVLSGHTHAGQIFPFSILVYLQQGFIYGLYNLSEKTKMYVSSGAGFWGPSIRFLAPSEIVIIELGE